MTVLGPGVGDNVGTVRIIQQREHETNAYAESNKLAMGIVPASDSLNRMFTDMAQRYVPGYIGGFGYKTTPSHPQLNLEKVRTERSFQQPADDSWRPQYDALVNMLPPDVKAAYLAKFSFLDDPKNQMYSTLRSVLEGTAVAWTQSMAAGQPAPQESVEAAVMALNLIFPSFTYQNSFQIGSATSQAVLDSLAENGANFPNFDRINNVSNQTQTIATLMQTAFNNLANSPDGKLNGQGSAAAQKAVAMLAALNSQLDNVTIGKNFQILPSALQAMEMFAAAFALSTPSIGALFISLSTALTALSTENSSLGLIGKDLNLVLNALSAGIAAAILPNGTIADKQLLSVLTTASLVVLIAIASQSAAKDSAAIFEMGLPLLASSESLQDIYKEFIAASGGDSQAQNTGSLILAQAATLFCIMSACIAGNKSPIDFIDSQSKNLYNGATAAIDVNGNPTSDASTATAIAMQQARAALENKDTDGAVNALNSLVEMLGGMPEGLQKDIAFLGKEVALIINMAQTVDTGEYDTGIMNV